MVTNIHEDIKMKRLLIAVAALTLTGCVMPQGDLVSSSEVGKARTVLDKGAYEGDLKFKNGTGLVYQRNTNQCGKNCNAHAELAAKLDRERAEREAAGNPEWERIVAREKEGYRRQEAMKRCERGIIMKSAILRERAYDATKVYGYGSEQSLKANREFVEFKNKSLNILNKCVKYGLSQNESN